MMSTITAARGEGAHERREPSHTGVAALLAQPTAMASINGSPSQPSPSPPTSMRDVASYSQLEESYSVCSSIGVTSTLPVPVEQASFGPLLDSKLSYYRTLSRNMNPSMQSLLQAPDQVLEDAVQVMLIGGKQGQAGSMSIIFTLWNTMMGSTLLVMPYGFQQVGWLLGLVLSIVTAIISKFSCSLILKYGIATMGPSAEFADLAQEHLGRVGWGASLFASIFVVLGAACAMHLYMTHSLSQLVTYPFHQGGTGVATAEQFPASLSAIITLVIAFPLANLPTMRLLAKFNMLGVACIVFQLLYAAVSAANAGVSPHVLETRQLARPAAAAMMLGIFSLSFFIHNSVLTIMRAAATPRHNQRDLSAAYVLVWICYAGMGVASNVCPPGGSSYSLDTPNHIFLEVEQPASLAAWQLLARLAVLFQCFTVYPVLLYIIRAQFFCAFIYQRPHPNWWAVLLINLATASITLLVVLTGITISDVLRFAGAFASLVCVYAVPAVVHARHSRLIGAFTPARAMTCLSLLLLGVGTAAVQFLPPAPDDKPPAAPSAPPPSSILGMAFQAAGM